jgi:hypothetical protein
MIAERLSSAFDEYGKCHRLPQCEKSHRTSRKPGTTRTVQKAKREYTYVAMSEVYKGTEVVISVTRIGENNWTSRAEYAVPGKAGVRLEPEATYATEEEARRAALQAAIESIDRGRVSRGKY